MPNESDAVVEETTAGVVSVPKEQPKIPFVPPKEPVAAPIVLGHSDAVVSLYTFAQNHAKKYGIELMGGFYHSHESKSHFADTEANWHALMEQFKGEEVT